ncbi:efflux RND transporter periplasmic adaptor subunit [Thermodesulfobacteriota bacterium]
MHTRSLIGFIYLCLALGSIPVLTGCDGSGNAKNAEPAKPRAVKVRVVKVEPVTMRDTLTLPGETEARRDLLIAAERDGKVEWVGVTEGQNVRKRQLLVKIDVAALKATLNRAEADFQMADERAERRKTLFSRKIVSEEALDESLTQRKLALGHLEEAKINYERGFVRCPIDGVVDDVPVDPGEFVKRGDPVARVVSTTTIRVNVRVPELDVRYLLVGQKVPVKIDAYPEDRWQGEIDFVAFRADPATKTFKVRVVVDNPYGKIRPGMIARVSFLRRVIPNALTAPLFAIMDRGGERIIFVEKDGIAHARTVEVGVVDQESAQIKSGLQPGENLIVTGQREIEEGMRVTAQ